MVAPENLGRIIDEHPFFAGIGDKLRALLVGCAANERFDPGQPLFQEGGPAKKFYLIRSGCVAVEIDVPGRPPIVIETVDDGDVLGWSWMVAPYRHSFTARASTLVRALSFDSTCLTAKMATDPALGYEVMRRFVPVMAHRIQSARMQMLDLYGPGSAPAADKPAVEVVRAVKKAKGTNRRADATITSTKSTSEKAKAGLVLAKGEKKKDKKKKTKADKGKADKGKTKVAV